LRLASFTTSPVILATIMVTLSFGIHRPKVVNCLSFPSFITFATLFGSTFLFSTSVALASLCSIPTLNRFWQRLIGSAI
jgi:hypothetical protein